MIRSARLQASTYILSLSLSVVDNISRQLVLLRSYFPLRRNYFTKMMKCIKFDQENSRVALATQEIPRCLRDDEIVVKIVMSGICGTDLHIIEKKFEANDGVILGHEMAGYVHETPATCTKFKAGDRVVLNPNISCSRCQHCKKGLYNFCEEGGKEYTLGISTSGGWAEYCKAHISLVFKISDDISYEQAVLCEPISCIVHGLDKLPTIDIGSNILIIGAGIIGLLWSSILHVLGHRRIFISEPNVERQITADNLKLGFRVMPWEKILHHQELSPEWKIDLCIDCSGNTGAIEAALPLLQFGAKFLIFGVADPTKTINVSPFELYKKEITLMGTAINTHTSFHKAVAILESLSDKYITLEKMAMKKFPLEQYENALKTFKTGTYSKIVFQL